MIRRFYKIGVVPNYLNIKNILYVAFVALLIKECEGNDC